MDGGDILQALVPLAAVPKSLATGMFFEGTKYSSLTFGTHCSGPFWNEIIILEDLKDIGVLGLEELLDCAPPLDLIHLKESTTLGVSLIGYLIPRHCFRTGGLLEDHAAHTFFGSRAGIEALRHRSDWEGLLLRMRASCLMAKLVRTKIKSDKLKVYCMQTAERHKK